MEGDRLIHRQDQKADRQQLPVEAELAIAALFQRQADADDQDRRHRQSADENQVGTLSSSSTSTKIIGTHETDLSGVEELRKTLSLCGR